MNDIKSIYRDVILDHYKRPRNASLLGEANDSGLLNQARCKNPSCGDKVLLQLQIADGLVAGVGYEGIGCAISQASASMMTMAIKGQPLKQVKDTLSEFRRMVVGGAEQPSLTILGDLISLQGIAKLHARVKCAMCAWSALEAVLEERGEIDMDELDSLPESNALGQ